MLVSFTGAYASFPVERGNVGTVATTQVVEKQDAEQNSQMTSKASSSGKSQLVALLLCIFAGVLGIHRFYLGYTWQGVVQLLTFGALGIWTFIDLIRIILGDLKPKGGDYAEKL